MLREPDLQLKKALDHCRSSEASKIQIVEIKGSGTSAEVNIVNRKTKFAKKDNKNTDKPKCKKCGFQHSIDNKCPAEGKSCLNCKKKNHFASVCKSKKIVKAVQHNDTSDSEESEEDQAILPIKRVNGVSSWKENINVSGKNVYFKVDTGSEVNIIPRNVYEALPNKQKLVRTMSKLTSYSEHVIKTLGKCKLNCCFKGKNTVLNFYVTEKNNDPILGGLNGATCFGLVPTH